ncbi:MAG: ECF transporter S component [Clostridia bacterium]|nr:ECF transporter S component [Clostridia bacterium]
MKNTVAIKKIVITAFCIALCVILPLAFHTVHNAGKVFCPMHIPVLLCGLICGWPFGMLCGFVGPLLSSLITGMPLMSLLPSMMLELAVYGAVTGFLMKVVHTKSTYVNLYISLISAMLSGRLVSGIANALIFSAGSYSFDAWITASFVTSLPGLIIQLAIIPTIVVTLKKAHLIPEKQSLDFKKKQVYNK